MIQTIAWGLVFTGILHLVFGLIKFRQPLANALASGFINQFHALDAYAAFWFLMSGPPLILSGHLAVHAVAGNDIGTLQVIGIYTLLSSLVGVLAFPKSPFWLPLVLAALLLGAGSFW